MAVAKRVIACLDVANGRVVKGVHFENLTDAGDPVELAARYNLEGVDELTFLDVAASKENRATMYDVVRRTAEQVFIPLTVGGGVRSVDDVRVLLESGADKVSINTAALAQPSMITDIAEQYGNQVLVLSVDARRVRGEDGTVLTTPDGSPRYEVTTHGGSRSAGIDAFTWIHEAQERGVGEILLNSMDADGTRQGFDVEMLTAVRAATSLPLIASGGAGCCEDFDAALRAGADAVLAASVFHFGTLTVGAVKGYLRERGWEVRA